MVFVPQARFLHKPGHRPTHPLTLRVFPLSLPSSPPSCPLSCWLLESGNCSRNRHTWAQGLQLEEQKLPEPGHHLSLHKSILGTRHCRPWYQFSRLPQYWPGLVPGREERQKNALQREAITEQMWNLCPAQQTLLPSFISEAVPCLKLSLHVPHLGEHHRPRAESTLSQGTRTYPATRCP